MLPLLAALVITVPLLQDTAHVVIVATTDLHGHAKDWDYLKQQPFAGGLVRVASVVDSLKARYPGQVIVADADLSAATRLVKRLPRLRQAA